MTTGGWICMLLSIGTVTSVLSWCLWRVLTKARPDHELGHVEPIEEDEADER